MAGDQSQQTFQVVMRGYDKAQVDERLHQLESALRDARARAEEADSRAIKLSGEITEAHRQLREVERPSYSGLGARIEQLLRLAEEQASDVIAAATKDTEEMLAQARVDASQTRAAAQSEAAETTAIAQRESAQVRQNATTEAEEIVASATRRAGEMLAVAEREAAKLKSVTEHETTEKRTTVDRDLARLRATVEREVTELRVAAKREVEELRANAKREADEHKKAAATLLEETRVKVEQATTDLEVKLAARREEAERLDAERHAAAVAQATQLVSEAEQRASSAEQRAVKVLEHSEQVRHDAEEHSKALVANARKNADQVLSEARASAEKTVSEAKAEAERTRRAAQRQVDELTRQRDSITGHLDQLRSLLGSGAGVAPNLERLAEAAAAPPPSLPDLTAVQTAGDIADAADSPSRITLPGPTRQDRSERSATAARVPRVAVGRSRWPSAGPAGPRGLPRQRRRRRADPPSCSPDPPPGWQAGGVVQRPVPAALRGRDLPARPQHRGDRWMTPTPSQDPAPDSRASAAPAAEETTSKDPGPSRGPASPTAAADRPPVSCPPGGPDLSGPVDPVTRFGIPGAPVNRGHPFYIGFMGALGVLLAWWLVNAIDRLSSVLTLLVTALFLSLGLDSVVQRLQGLGLRRRWAMLAVVSGVLTVFVGFVSAVVPPLVDQATDFSTSLPDLVDDLMNTDTVKKWDKEYGLFKNLNDQIQERLTSGDTALQVFGGVFGAGKAIVSSTFNAFTVLVLTVYFLGSMHKITESVYRMVPRSRRDRVRLLGDEIIRRIGGYIIGQLAVATINGVCTFFLLTAIGVDYPLVLAIIVGLLGLIPLVGATLGAAVVLLVALFDSWQIALVVLVYYVIYQQVENYVISPRIMARTVAVPGAIAVVAALAGGTLMGVLGALLAIPVAAGILLIVEEVFMPRQERS